MRPRGRRQTLPSYQTARQQQRKQGFGAHFGPAILGGAVLVLSFAFAGHIIGKNAVAHNADIEDVKILPPIVNVASKGSLLPETTVFDIVDMKVAREQTISQDGKGDPILVSPVERVPPPLTLARSNSRFDETSGVRIEPAALDLREDDNRAVQRLALTPKPARIENEFSLSKPDKAKVVAQRRVRLAEENCLARAVYFEARSESDVGQMAVAKVILNRTKAPGFPKSICGVVYQGSNNRNACQFSFACDGLPDDVKQPAAWAQARRIAQKAISGQSGGVSKLMGDAVNYHADYVNPKWSKTMKRLVKIGRHVFYAGG